MILLLKELSHYDEIAHIDYTWAFIWLLVGLLIIVRGVVKLIKEARGDWEYCRLHVKYTSSLSFYGSYMERETAPEMWKMITTIGPMDLEITILYSRIAGLLLIALGEFVAIVFGLAPLYVLGFYI